MRRRLRMTADQHARLAAHVLAPDGCEAAAVLICGRGRGDDAEVLTVREVHPVPYEACPVREPDRLTWRTETIAPLVARAAKEGLAVVKAHGHPGGRRAFSPTDDAADRELFRSVHGWTDDGRPHGSLVVVPGGECIARFVDEAGAFAPVDLVTVVGDDLRLFWRDAVATGPPGFARRHAQAFGEGTADALRRLSVAVVGVSGTGGPVVEQLQRLGVGRLVLVDPDRVEELNLNRIPHATRDDALRKRPKVDVAAEAVRRTGLGTEVVTYARNLKDPEVVRAIATCDLVFGCMDGAEGRHLLNRLATFYVLPYIDVGVRLDADGRGGVSQICGSIHWLTPGGSSLLSRGVISLDEVAAEGLRRQSPAEYRRRREEKYIKGIREDRPAVVSVNTTFAGLAVTELLARLHPFRDDGNAPCARLTCTLSQVRFECAEDGPPCPVLARHVGRGDVVPLLLDPELSETERAA
ncbi:MAG: ThiF family adenylyltransferase [Deltaproteobacteria bacterium]|nr:ThiF family adenylyltransferase [Deltaproteobacteria bacterium]